jgi:dipeptidyl aminopeptidase/acylaminoacyl peptidase
VRPGKTNTATARAVAAFAVLAAAASVIAAVAPSPAVSQSRNRDGFRDPDRARKGNASNGYDTRQADNAQPPARFVAEFDGRIVVVSAETGRVERDLTTAKPGGGASDPAVSPDGRTVWFARDDGRCASHLASVPVAGGSERRVPGSGEVGPEARPLPRPGRAQLAYARRSCDKPGTALIVGDLAGLEGHGRSGLVPVAWNRSGDRLLATTAATHETRLLEISEAGAIVAGRPLQPADSAAGCRLDVVGFSPDDNDGYVAFRRCGPGDERGRRSLVLLDRDGNVRRTVLRLSRSQDFTDRPAFGPTGHSLLFATVPVDRGEQAAGTRPAVTLWLWRDGEARPLDRQSRFRQPVWLP